MSETIRIDELLKECERLQAENKVEGFTSTELGELWGISRNHALKKLRDISKNGFEVKMVGKRSIKRMDGHFGLTPVYQVRKLPKTKKLK